MLRWCDMGKMGKKYTFYDIFETFFVFLKLLIKSVKYTAETCKICYKSLRYLQQNAVICAGHQIEFWSIKLQVLLVKSTVIITVIDCFCLWLQRLQSNYSGKRNTSNGCKIYSRNICSVVKCTFLKLMISISIHE